MITCAVHATVLFSRRESRAVGEDPAPLLGGTPYTHVQRAKLIITHPQKFVTSTTSIMMEGNQTICRLLKTFSGMAMQRGSQQELVRGSWVIALH